VKRRSIMVGVVDFIMRQKDGPQRIVRKNQEELIVTPTSAGTPHKNNPGNSILRCLPASEKGDLCHKLFRYMAPPPMHITRRLACLFCP